MKDTIHNRLRHLSTVVLLLLLTAGISFAQTCYTYPSVSGATGCAGQSYTLYATTFGGNVTNHIWYTSQSGSSTVGVSISNPGSGIVQSTLTSSFSASVTYWVAAVCNGGQTGRQPVSFTAVAPSTLSYSNSIDPMSVGSSNNLTITASGGVWYEWRYNTTSSSPIATGNTYVPTKGGQYWLRGATTCGDVSNQMIFVNYLPYADAGSDQSIGLPSSYIVYGSGSDPEGAPITFSWTLVSTTSSVTMGTTNTSALTLTSIAAGTHTFRLTVTDAWSKTAYDDVTITASSLVNNYNYVQQETIKIPNQTTYGQVNALTVTDKATQISYSDGLGKTMQSIQKQGSPTSKDIVTTAEYDPLGRPAKSYPSISSTQSTGYFIPNVLGSGTYSGSMHYNFYNATSDKIADDPAAYSQTVFESSPLGRPIQKGSIGQAWQPGTGAYKTISYGTNAANDVLQWAISGTLPISSATWPANTLSANTVTDEQSLQSQTFTSPEGLNILSRTNIDATTWAETYSVFDAYNQLRFLLPPELMKVLKSSGSFVNPTQAQIDTWAYQYNYDNLGRQTESKVPGAGWVYAVYDTRDRLVLSQDANQRANNEWSYTKYDGLNRPGESGIYRPGAALSRQAMQDQVDAYYAANPTAIDIVLTSYVGINNYVASNSITLKPGFTFTAATSGAFSAIIRNQTADNAAAAFPNDNAEKLVVTYYDSYTNCSFCSTPEFSFTTETWASTSNEPFTAFYRLKDKVVASSVKVLGTNNWLNTVTYYNRNGQTIQTIGSNHLGGRDRVSTLFDFSGKKLEELHTAINYNSGGIATMRKRFDYDHAGRLLKVYHKINSQNEVMLSAFEYNELGQVVKKKLHSEDGGTNYLQSLDYRYNIRGWLTNLNNIPSVGDTGDDTNDYFGLTMNYHNTVSGAGNNPRTDGLVSAIHWKNDLSTKQRLYNFSYDNLKQVSGATHKMSSTAGNWSNEADFFNEAGISYDLNGNIKNLSRNTEFFNGTGYTAEPIDQLTYDYGTGGNQLQFVKDNIASANKDKGFKDGGTNTTTDPDYVYDANGNVTKDQNKGITNITYYFNNLPKRVTFSDGSYLENIYDAAGIKLSTIYNKAGTNPTTVTTDYVGASVLLNGQVLVVNHEEGRITAPTYSNLMDNKDAGSTAGFPAHGGTATITSEYLNNQTYVKVVASSQNTGNMGIWPMQTTKGSTYTVKPGETYSFKVLGFQSVGTNVKLYVSKPDLTSIVWPGAQLPIGSANEDWVTASFTVPAGVTQISVGVYGATPDAVFYINKVALYKTDFEYNYFLEDQVGSPRVVLQTTPATITYMATMETENLVDESAKFQNLTAANIVMSPGNSTPGGNEVIKLNAQNKIGPAKSIRVYPGDKINASAMSYYINQGGFSKTPNATMATLLAPVFGGVAGAPGDPGSIFSNVGQAYGNSSTLGLSPNQGTIYPSAFLNFILFDKNYKPLDGKSVPISTAANAPQPLALPEITALEVGYVFIYLSYDNDTGGDVFFDDLKITVQESPVIQVNNYYPFGMQSYTWLREGETDNAYLFQGKELIAQTGWHDFGSRMYYADLGRWFATDPQKQFSSPYNGMGNNPVMGVDPNGEFFVPIIIGAVLGGLIQGSNAWVRHQDIGDALWKGALVGAIGGALGQFGGGTFLSNVLWGAGEGAVTGGIGSALNGGNFWDGALQGAAWGAGFATVTSSIEGFRNLADKNVRRFGTNDGISDRLVDDAVTDYVGSVDPAKAQSAIDFIQKRYDMNGVSIKYEPNLKPYGFTSIATGDVSIGPGAFQNNSSSLLKATMVHEYAHSLKDRITLFGKGSVTPSYTGTRANWNYLDGTTGYSNEIFNAGRIGINKTTLSFINSNKAMANPVWHQLKGQPGFIKNKWSYLLPRRLGNKVKISYP